MRDSLVTVFGGGGFLGRYVVQALLKAGARVRVAERSPKNAYFLKAQANLGQITYVAADITRPDTLGPAVVGADAVVNLVGSFADMQRIHVDGAGNLARAATAAGVQAFVHMSAIGADVESRSVCQPPVTVIARERENSMQLVRFKFSFAPSNLMERFPSLLTH